MRHRSTLTAVFTLLAVVSAGAREIPSLCGTYRGRIETELQLHRLNQRALRARRGGGVRLSAGAATAAPGGTAPAARPDVNNIAIVDASDGAVMMANRFDLGSKTLTFTPGAQGYSYVLAGDPYDQGAAEAGTIDRTMDDDDFRAVTLPFRFPFFGKQYDQVYVHSDGNLTFGRPDAESTARSVQRLKAGPPRIAPLFEDLDPRRSQYGVSVNSSPTRLVISWRQVPEFQEIGIGALQTAQARLYPDGRIEFAWPLTVPTSAVVGISPGNLENSSSLVNFTEPSGISFAGAVAERFGSQDELDFFAIGQKFYETHDDAYDYLIIFNGLDMKDGQYSLASTRVARNNFTGNGDFPANYGWEFGSKSRLQAVVHMAYPGAWPADLTQKLFREWRPTDDSIGVLAHEVGHLWLAYASHREPDNPDALPLLGNQSAHWSFNFNSEASLLQGETIQDLGGGLFRTVDATNRYSPLDLYLMGLRPAYDVMPLHHLFYVAGSPISNTALPRIGVDITGTRRDVHIDEIIAANGRRTPDWTVSQKRFRLAFIYVVSAGQEPNQADLDQITRFRTMFPAYFNSRTDDRAWAETTLQRSMQVSTFPGAGVLVGSTATATITLETPPEANLTINLRSNGGQTVVPSQVTIPAGATTTSFTFQGVRAGVDQVVAEPADAIYETVQSNVQVLESAAGLSVNVISGNNQTAQPNMRLAEPVVLRVVDANNLPYPGITVSGSVRNGGTLDQASVTSDASGYVRFGWTTGATSLNELTVRIDGAPAATTTVYAWSAPEFTSTSVVNAASYTNEVPAGGIASLFGINLAPAPAWASSLPLPGTLANTQVLINGAPAPLLYVSPLQVNFYVPTYVAPGQATFTVLSQFGTSAPVQVTVSQFAPAIFDDPVARVGAIVVSGKAVKTDLWPAKPGDYIEIYATGLGPVNGDKTTTTPVRVYIAEQLVSDVPYAGLSSYVGLYQVNARVPAGLAPGRYPVVVEAGTKRSNTVYIEVR